MKNDILKKQIQFYIQVKHPDGVRICVYDKKGTFIISSIEEAQEKVKILSKNTKLQYRIIKLETKHTVFSNWSTILKIFKN